MVVGSASGHGRYGILEDDGERVLCHECGGWYRSIGHHLPPAHGMSPASYREVHGLPRRLGLVSAASSAKASASARGRLGGEAWGRLVESRDPEMAASTRGAGVHAASGRGQGRYRTLARDTIAQAAGYADMAGALAGTADLGPVEAARRLGVPESSLRRWRLLASSAVTATAPRRA